MIILIVAIVLFIIFARRKRGDETWDIGIVIKCPVVGSNSGFTDIS